jgi:AAA15 family ATPase/GTPase
MLKEYQIENFKAFAGPVNIPIKPITLIFGANSSGKSSIFQSLLMLKQTLQEGKDSNISLLPRGNIVDLGSYREFIRNHDATRSFSFKMTFSTPKEICQHSGIDWLFNDF